MWYLAGKKTTMLNTSDLPRNQRKNIQVESVIEKVLGSIKLCQKIIKKKLTRLAKRGFVAFFIEHREHHHYE